MLTAGLSRVEFSDDYGACNLCDDKMHDLLDDKLREMLEDLLDFVCGAVGFYLHNNTAKAACNTAIHRAGAGGVAAPA